MDTALIASAKKIMTAVGARVDTTFLVTVASTPNEHNNHHHFCRGILPFLLPHTVSFTFKKDYSYSLHTQVGNLFPITVTVLGDLGIFRRNHFADGSNRTRCDLSTMKTW